MLFAHLFVSITLSFFRCSHPPRLPFSVGCIFTHLIPIIVSPSSDRSFAPWVSRGPPFITPPITSRAFSIFLPFVGCVSVRFCLASFSLFSFVVSRRISFLARVVPNISYVFWIPSCSFAPIGQTPPYILSSFLTGSNNVALQYVRFQVGHLRRLRHDPGQIDLTECTHYPWMRPNHLHRPTLFRDTFLVCRRFLVSPSLIFLPHRPPALFFI